MRCLQDRESEKLTLNFFPDILPPQASPFLNNSRNADSGFCSIGRIALFQRVLKIPDYYDITSINDISH